MEVKKYLPNKTKKQIGSKVRNLNLIAPPINKSSKYKYVTKRGDRYCVSFRVNGKTIYFGTTYDNEDEAEKVAMEMAKKYGKVV